MLNGSAKFTVHHIELSKNLSILLCFNKKSKKLNILNSKCFFFSISILLIYHFLFHFHILCLFLCHCLSVTCFQYVGQHVPPSVYLLTHSLLACFVHPFLYPAFQQSAHLPNICYTMFHNIFETMFNMSDTITVVKISPDISSV